MIFWNRKRNSLDNHVTKKNDIVMNLILTMLTIEFKFWNLKNRRTKFLEIKAHGLNFKFLKSFGACDIF